MGVFHFGQAPSFWDPVDSLIADMYGDFLSTVGDCGVHSFTPWSIYTFHKISIAVTLTSHNMPEKLCHLLQGRPLHAYRLSVTFFGIFAPS